MEANLCLASEPVPLFLFLQQMMSPYGRGPVQVWNEGMHKYINAKMAATAQWCGVINALQCVF